MASRFAILLMLSALISVIGACDQAIAQRTGFGIPTFPRTSLRGRIHIRNGPFANVYREHWGGGLSDNAVVLGNAAIGGFVQVAPSLFSYLGGLPGGGGGESASMFGPESAQQADCPESAAPPPPSNDPNFETRRKDISTLRERQRALLVLLEVPPEKIEEAMRESVPPPTPEAPAGAGGTSGDNIPDPINNPTGL